MFLLLSSLPPSTPRLAGKNGIESTSVQWTSIRKITRERAREFAADDDTEYLFSEESGLVLNPASRPMRVWYTIVRLVAIYHFIAVPVRVVYRPFSHMYQIELLCTDLPADILTILHILVCLNTSYHNKKSRKVYNRFKIAKHYFSNFFFLDLLAAFPLDWISMAQGVDPSTAEWLRVTKMLFVRSTSHLVVTLGSGASGSGLQGLSVTAFFLLHLSATLWSALGLTDLEFITLGEPSWFRAETGLQFLSGVSLGDSEQLTMWELYTLSLNWVATHTVSAIGNSTLYPKNYFEVFFAIFQLTIGMTFYRMFMGKISTLVMKKDEKIIKVRGELSSLESYIVSNSLDDDKLLAEEIRRNFVLKNSSTVIEMSSILNELSFSLQFELASLICRAELDHITLFRGCSDAALDSLSISLREVVFGPEEVLFKHGDVADEMFIVMSGSVDKIEENPMTGNESVTGVLKKGSAIGELSFAFGMKHLFTARAKEATGATCMRLSRSAYLEVLKLFPEDQDLVTANSLISFDTAKTERNKSSKRSASVQGSEKSSGQDLEAVEEEVDKSIDSHAAESDVNSEENMVGANISNEIESLKTHQKDTQVQQLLDAAYHGDVPKLDKLLKRGTTMLHANDADSHQRTALHVASSEVSFCLLNKHGHTYQ